MSLAARGFLLVLVVCLHAAGTAALSRLPGPSRQGEEPAILRASWIEHAPSPLPPSIRPAELRPVLPPPPTRRMRSEVSAPSQPQVVRSAPASTVVDAAPDVPTDQVDSGDSGDSTPAPGVDVFAAAAASETAGGEGKNEEGSWGKGYVGPNIKTDYLHNPKPRYPYLSKRQHEEGLVKLKVHVTKEGLPDKVTLHESSGYDRLDKAALNAVKNWRFIPKQQDGVPVASETIVPIPFKLED